ncbi:MAG: hypothetical protein WBJ81_04040, partial [Rickettsiales bacterium]
MSNLVKSALLASTILLASSVVLAGISYVDGSSIKDGKYNEAYKAAGLYGDYDYGDVNEAKILVGDAKNDRAEEASPLEKNIKQKVQANSSDKKQEVI